MGSSDSHFDHFYLLSFSPKCTKACSYCPGIGCRNSDEKGLDGVDRSIAKAKSGEYSHIVLSCNWVDHPLADNYIKRILLADLQVVLQVHWQDLEGSEIWREKYPAASFNVLLDSEALASLPPISNQLKRGGENYCTLIVSKELDLTRYILQLPDEIRRCLHLYFPFHLKPADDFLPSFDIATQLDLLRSSIPDFKIYPQRGHEVFDPRVRREIELELLGVPVELSSSKNMQIKISVVVTVEGRTASLNSCVQRLLKQSLSAELFEITIVGSAGVGIKKLTEDVSGRNVYFLPGPKGDHDVVGPMRNLGVKSARGEILAFLDSDVLVPEDYLEQLVNLHEMADLVWQECGGRGGTSEFLGMRQSGCLGMSIDRRLFKKMGGFKKSFISKGLANVDLAYRVDLSTGHCVVAGISFDRMSTKPKLDNRAIEVLYQNFLHPEIFMSYRRRLSGNIFSNLIVGQLMQGNIHYLLREIRSELFGVLRLTLWWLQYPLRALDSLWLFIRLEGWRIGSVYWVSVKLFKQVMKALNDILRRFGRFMVGTKGVFVLPFKKLYWVSGKLYRQATKVLNDILRRSGQFVAGSKSLLAQPFKRLYWVSSKLYKQTTKVLNDVLRRCREVVSYSKRQITFSFKKLYWVSNRLFMQVIRLTKNVVRRIGRAASVFSTTSSRMLTLLLQPLLRIFWLCYRLIYPLRKIFYFANYQWKIRFGRRDSARSSDSKTRS